MGSRIGIVGYGTIGSKLVSRIYADPDLSLAFVYDFDQSKLADLDPRLCLSSLEGGKKKRPDLVVEVVGWKWIKDYAPVVLEYSNLLIVSVAAFAEEGVKEKLDAVAQAHQTRYYLAHGPLIGLDGIRDGRELIKDVTVTTIRPQRGYGLAEKVKEETILFDGTAREACLRFPKNVNLHGSVAMYGLGFDRTRSVVVAKPGATVLKHTIEVRGPGLTWFVEVKGRPSGKWKYSPFVLESVFKTIKNICKSGYGLQLI